MAVLLISCAASARAESIDLVTYYPTASNAGDLHVRSITVGTAYQNVDMSSRDGTALIVDRVGIGTTTPQGSLHVVGPDNQPDTALFMPGAGTGTMRVGIGIADPLGPLHLAGDITLDYSGNDPLSGAEFSSRRSRGTPDAPAAVQVGDDLGGFQGLGYNGTGYAQAVAIDPVTDQVPVAGQRVAAMLVFHMQDPVRMLITSGGNVGMGTAVPVSTLEVNGSLGLRTTVVAGDTALNNTHNVVLCSNGANITVTLPAAAGRAGRTYTLKKISNNTARVTISAPATTIDGAATLVLFQWKDSVTLLCDGAGWQVISDDRLPLTAKMSRRAAQSIPNSPGPTTWTVIDFDTVDYNNGNIANAGTNLFVIPRDGYYRITTHWYLTPGSSGRVGIQINGAGHEAEDLVGTAPDNPALRDVFFLQAGDQVQMIVSNSTGAAVNTHTSPQHWPRMTVTEVR